MIKLTTQTILIFFFSSYEIGHRAYKATYENKKLQKRRRQKVAVNGHLMR